MRREYSSEMRAVGGGGDNGGCSGGVGCDRVAMAFCWPMSLIPLTVFLCVVNEKDSRDAVQINKIACELHRKIKASVKQKGCTRERERDENWKGVKLIFTWHVVVVVAVVA